MQMNELTGIWKLESNAGELPADLGIKVLLHEFKDDGTVVVAGIRLSQFQGLIPESKYRAKGTWQLENDILELTSDEDSCKAKIVINNDILEMTFIYADDNIYQNTIVRHKRVNL